MLILRQNETEMKRYTSEITFPNLLRIFTSTLNVCTNGRRSVVTWRNNQIFSDPQVLNFL